jgi:membrane protein DedA with SNARE-associated domain
MTRTRTNSQARLLAAALTVAGAAALALPAFAFAGTFYASPSSFDLASIFNISAGLGYPLMFVIVVLETGCGIPFAPGELAIATAGIAAGSGRLNIWLVIVIGAAAAIIGDNIGYSIGRSGGRRVLESPKGPFARQRQSMVQVGDPFFDKHGPKAVFFGRWLPVLRVFTSWFAGGNRMRWWPTFLFWNAAGAICWATSVALLGYFGGGVAKKVINSVGLYGLIFVACGLVFAYLMYRRHNRRMLERLAAQAPELQPAEADPAAGFSQAPVMAPSTTRSWPLTKLDSSLARNTAACAISSGRPARGIGCALL